MIQARDLVVRRGAGPALLDGVSLSIPPGQVTAILGPNGAGKTTLLRVLAGLSRAQAGQVTLDGQPLAGFDRLSLARRRAVLGQQQALEFGLLVQDVVALGRLPFAGTAAARADRAAIAAARDLFGLAPFWHRAYPALSGGERQRVQLARVTAQLWRSDGEAAPGTRALFLDEPTAPLDLRQQQRTLDAARALARTGIAVIEILHDLNQAAQADRAILLREGRLLAAGPVAEVLQPARLADAFGVSVEVLRRGDGRTGFLVA